MLKKYEKPKILMMNLVGNEQLCGSCADADWIISKDDPEFIDQYEWLIGNGDGVLSREEIDNVFGANDSCKNVLVGYCKFTSSGTLVAWS